MRLRVTPARPHAETPIRPHAVTPTRRYAHTPLRHHAPHIPTSPIVLDFNILALDSVTKSH